MGHSLYYVRNKQSYITRQNRNKRRNTYPDINLQPHPYPTPSNTPTGTLTLTLILAVTLTPNITPTQKRYSTYNPSPGSKDYTQERL